VDSLSSFVFPDQSVPAITASKEKQKDRVEPFQVGCGDYQVAAEEKTNRRHFVGNFLFTENQLQEELHYLFLGQSIKKNVVAATLQAQGAGQMIQNQREVYPADLVADTEAISPEPEIADDALALATANVTFNTEVVLGAEHHV
jgi:hypothetical protein